MKKIKAIKENLRDITVIATLFFVLSSAANSARANDVIQDWNQHAVKLSLTLPPPPRQLRAMAIVHVSVHDAVNGITREYETYGSPGSAPNASDPRAAAVGAAYGALLGLFGDGPHAALGGKTLGQVFTESLTAHSLSENDPGIEYGLSAASAILALRSIDGNAQAGCPYVDLQNPLPGEWVRIINPSPPPGPFPPAALPCWKNVTPWVLHSGSQFRPEVPPDLLSERYAKDYNEVMLLGELNSSTRTAEQTQIARFWDGSPTNIWNQVLNQVAAAGSHDISDNARAFALVFMTGTDASIACWDAKYFHNSWRPITATARAGEDGNPDTIPVSGWQSFIPTWQHQHPEYPSGNSMNSSGLGSAMALIFGDEPGMTMTPTISGITREWNSFSQGIDEVVDARVYAGLHFRYSNETGARMGRQVAQFVSTHALRPCRGNGTRCNER